jgi:hypothetical protein
MTDRINEIATLARDIRAKKQDCYNIVIKLIEGREATDLDLAELYQFFMPPTPAKPKTDIHWLLKAKANKDIRNYLNYLYSDGSRLYATDGHRLHILMDANHPAGFYDSELNKLDIDYKYPDIDRVIPHHQTQKDMRVVDLQAYEVRNIEGVNSPSYEAGKVGKAWISRPYLDAAISRFDKSRPVRVSYGGEHEAIKFLQGDLVAVVMPVRVD